MHPPLPHGRVFCLQVVFNLYLVAFTIYLIYTVCSFLPVFSCTNSYIYRILYTGYGIYGVKYVYADGIHVFCPQSYFTP